MTQTIAPADRLFLKEVARRALARGMQPEDLADKHKTAAIMREILAEQEARAERLREDPDFALEYALEVIRRTRAHVAAMEAK